MTTHCSACGRDQTVPERLREDLRGCGECTALVSDLRHISAALDGRAAQASAGLDPNWARGDDAVFLAHFRERLRRSSAGAEDLWRWLAVRLWPVSAGLLVGAFFALGDRSQEGVFDLEGMTLAYESSQSEIEPDVLGDFLAPALERDGADASGRAPTADDFEDEP